ncbi:MAG TPA: SWIM zinc finger family protein, partial [Phormidium sp.]
FTLSEVHSRCSCPDKEIPCKHIGAVYYQLGDRFSEDPFVIFQLRGRTKEQIIDVLRKLRGGGDVVSQPETTEAPVSEPPRQPTPINIEQFWQYNEPLDSSLVVIAPPSGDTILDVLGPIPLGDKKASDSQRVMQYLDAIYKAVSQQSMLSAMNVEGS